MLNAINSAFGGFHGALTRLDAAAARIAGNGASDVARDMIDLMQAEHEVRANVGVIRTADDMIGTLLDVLA